MPDIYHTQVGGIPYDFDAMLERVKEDPNRSWDINSGDQPQVWVRFSYRDPADKRDLVTETHFFEYRSDGLFEIFVMRETVEHAFNHTRLQAGRFFWRTDLTSVHQLGEYVYNLLKTA